MIDGQCERSQERGGGPAIAEDEHHRQRVRKTAGPQAHHVQIDLVAGSHGAAFQLASLRVPARTVCLWRNQSGQPQEVLPVGDGPPFKGGPLPAGGARLVLARNPATFALRLASNPAASITIEVTAGA